MTSEDRLPLHTRAREALIGLGATPGECLALALLGAGALAALGLLWLVAQPAADGALATAADDGQPAPAAAAGAAGSEPPDAPPGDGPFALAAGEVVVHVAGRVAEPGLYRLAGGSRVGDALAAAGGPLDDAVLEGVNLARVLADGEQVHVPSAEDLEAASSAATDPGSGSAGSTGPGSGDSSGGAAARGAAVGGAWRADGTLDLNRATPADLEQLPGVGPVTAGKIVDHRELIGGFRDVSELQDVAGIGPKRFADLLPRVGV